MASQLPEISDFNALGKQAFVETIHILFEPAPPLADRVSPYINTLMW
jgi:hypothetical protein